MKKKDYSISPPIGINLSNMREFEELFECYYTPLCVFAMQYIEDEDAVNDVVQDCFVKLWEQGHKILYLHQAKAFLYTSVKNQSLNELSHNLIVQKYVEKEQEKESEFSFLDKVIEEETYRILVGAIEKLPKRMQQVMLLALEGNSNGEIAEEMSVSVENVHTLKKSAYVKLRAYLKDYYYILLLFY